MNKEELRIQVFELAEVLRATHTEEEISATMQRYWQDVKSLEDLAWVVAHWVGPAGSDLHFPQKGIEECLERILKNETH